MSAVLDYFRQREPRFKEVPDNELTQFIGDNYPQFKQDSEFGPAYLKQTGQLTVTEGPAEIDDTQAQIRRTTTTGGPKVALPEAAVAGAAFDDALKSTISGRALSAPGGMTARGGKLLLGATADLATLYPGGNAPAMENIRAYANDTDKPLPVQEGLAEMRGIKSLPTKVAAGLIQVAPALGTTVGLGMAGVPGPLAAAIPFSATEENVFDPAGAVIAAGLPGVTRLGEEAAAQALAKMPFTKVAVEVISRDPYKLKGRIVQKLGNVEISNDLLRQYFEKGGGAIAANAYLAAVQAPEIMALPPEQRGEAAMDAVASNLAMSLIGFAGRERNSKTLEKLYPKVRTEWEKFWRETQQQKGGEARGDARPTGPTPASPTGPTPVPEPPATTAAQGAAAVNPATPKSTVLQTPGEAPPPQPGLKPVPTNQGTAWVNPAKADPETVAEEINAGGGGTELGMSTETKPPGDAVVQTKNASGDVVQEEVVTPETLPGAIAAGEAVAPGGTQEIKPPEQILQERIGSSVASPHPGNNVADYVRAKLAAGEAVERMNVLTMGGTLGLTEKEAEEWAELGSTEAARDIAQTADMTDREKFAALVSLYDRMPRNVTRTVETKVSQQYSTPPPLAWVGAVLADFAGGKKFGEPTAGHGMLMIGANPKAQFFLNEIDQQRNQRLQRFAGVNSFPAKLDATTSEIFHWLKDAPVDRVGQNPPFGSVLNETGTGNKEFPIINAATKAKTTTSIDLAIALNTFEAMTKDGKGFAIIGSKTGTPWGGTFGTDAQRTQDYRRPVMMEFFERFNVVDWFTIGGDLYRKMGAAWPVDMIVVHGKGKTPRADAGGVARPWVKPPRVIESWEELAKLIPNENLRPPTSAGQTGGSPGGTRPSPPAPRPGGGPGGSAVSPARPERPAGGSRPGSGDPAAPPAPSPNPTPAPPPVRAGDSSAGIGQGTPQPPTNVAEGGAKPGQPGTPPVGGTRPVAAGSGADNAKQPGVELNPSAGGASIPASQPPARQEPRPTKAKPSVPVEGLPASLMVPFQSVSKGLSLNLVAPRNIATQMQQAANDLQKEVGMPIDEYVAAKLGRDVKTLLTQLAGAQVDTAALAIRNIERGSALICAHETGVGKGRVVAALIEYARMRGRIPVFVTAKPNLYEDMVARDLPALGNKDFKPFITNTNYAFEDAHGNEVKGRGTAAGRVAEMEQIVRTGNLPAGTEGIFTTYDQLKGDKPAGWTESPKAKFKRKGGRDGKNAQARPDGPRFAMLRALAPRAIFILDESHLAAGPGSEVNLSLSQILPTAAGIYYSSATFAKRPDNLGLYSLGTLMKQTGLNHEQMTEALQKGGVPLQQALTSMLAESGELIRAQQDWTGVPMSFETTATNPAAVVREVEAADTYTSFIRDLITLNKLVNRAGAALEDGENQVRADEQQVKMQDINPMARLFNLSNQYLFALRADAVANKAIAELKAGRKPFIHVHNTLEGPLLDLRARKLPMNFQGILLREMHKMLTLTVRDPMAEGGKRQVDLQPEDLPDGGAFFRQLEKQILATDMSEFPISPIDHIKKKIQAAGYSMGEITARDGEVDDTGGEVTITKRDKAARNKILKNYNDGQLDVLLINGSGGTGLSAHTDPRFKDQRQRSYIEGQPAPDINDEMQAMGRTMRSGQTSKPRYTFPTTALAAERRFATMLRGKMTSLNANTTAEGESGLTQQEGFADDIFNQVGDDVVFRVMAANPVESNLMELGTGNEDADVTDGFARRATGRFVLLPNADAQRLWDEIIAEYRDEIQRLDEEGQNPLRATAEDLRARTLETTEIVAASGTTLFDGAANLEKAIVKPPKAPPTHEAAIQRARDNIPVTKQRAREWLDKSKAAEAERIATATSRGNTPEQIDRIRANMAAVREAITEAFRKLGDTFGVDKLGDGSNSFYGVAAELKLSDKQISDFSSMSRHELILTSNTFSGRYRIPLSKLFKNGEEQPLLNLIDEEAAAEQFNSTAESNAERHIITGNLLRGWEAADSATSAREMGRPRVAIYTREDGSLNTGILMPPGWTPGEAAEAQQVITNFDEFTSALYRGTLRSLPTSSVHPVEIRRVDNGIIVEVPSGGNGKMLWGDPQYSKLFAYPPKQIEGGKFSGRVGWPRELFDMLTAKGVRLVSKPSESAAMRGPGGGAAARGAFVSGVPRTPGTVPPTVQFGGMQFVRPLQLPELTRLVRELTGQSPRVRKLRGVDKTGDFTDGMVTLDPRIFKDPEVAGKVLAHEIGHLVDYLPHETLRRGNLLGHLLALKGWLKQTFGPLNNKDLKAELTAVTQWWRPYNPATDPKSYVQYRQSPEELYADALSVMFNAPAELEQRAPKFYEAFWKELGRRQDVHDALFAVQDLLNKGMLPTAAEREANLERAFAEGEARWKEAVANREKQARSWDGWWTRLWQELYWNFYPLEQRASKVEARGVDLPLERDPRKFLDDLGYRDVTTMAWGRHIFEKVVKPLEDAGLTLEDAGKFLFYQRVLNGDRAPLANPGGMTPEAARLGLLKMNLDLGLGKLTLLQDAIRVFHEDVFKLAQQAVDVGAYNKSTFDRVIAPNKDSYATFAVLDYLDDYVPAGIKEQIGTLKDVANPFQATILKSIGLINLIAYQQAKNGTVKFLQDYYPQDIQRVPGDREPPHKKGFGTFMRLENGRPAWYYTDPYIADAFTKLNPRQLWWFTRAADGIFRKLIYPLIITYNPGFLYFMSPLRDVQRTARNLPGARFSVGTLPLSQARELRETAARYGGTSGPLIREMEANLGLGTPFDQLARQHRDDFMADLLRRMRVLPDHAQQGFFNSNIFKPARKVLDYLEWGGMTLDAVAKTAAYRRLRAQGWSPKRAAYWVRNNAGLPNINKKGLLVKQVRALVPFWNVAVQGWRADLKNLSHPNTRSGWWWRYIMSNGFLRAFLALAAAGALGEALKELFAGISEYDKTNYLSIPVGATTGEDFPSKTAFLRIPEDETARMLGGIISKGIRAMGPDDVRLSGMFDFGMGQIPSLNPAVSVPMKWAQFAAGHNPIDPYRNREIVPARNWEAGGLDSLQPMAAWTLDQTGVGNFFRYDANANTTLQLTLSAVPGVNRMVKVSDQGYREKQRALMNEVDAARNMQKLKLPAEVQSLEMEYWRLAKIKKDQRTEPQQLRYEDLHYWYARTYRPYWESIEAATEDKNSAQAEALRRDLAKDSAPYYRVRR